MMQKDGLTELAMMFKDRESKPAPSITTGIVITSPPEPEIRLNDVVVLDKEHLIFGSSIVGGYERRLKFTDTDCGTTTVVSQHSHGIQEIHVDTLAQWTDTLVAGDEVILMPVVDGQLYFVIDKAVRF